MLKKISFGGRRINSSSFAGRLGRTAKRAVRGRMVAAHYSPGVSRFLSCTLLYFFNHVRTSKMSGQPDIFRLPGSRYTAVLRPTKTHPRGTHGFIIIGCVVSAHGVPHTTTRCVPSLRFTLMRLPPFLC